MKGLMIKDAKLLKNQGKLLAVMLVVVAGIMYFATDVNAMFIVGYITIIFAMFTATTISYDGFDNCYLFLMTLPVTRKKYVNEKYLYTYPINKSDIDLYPGLVIQNPGYEE